MLTFVRQALAGSLCLCVLAPACGDDGQGVESVTDGSTGGTDGSDGSDGTAGTGGSEGTDGTSSGGEQSTGNPVTTGPDPTTGVDPTSGGPTSTTTDGTTTGEPSPWDGEPLPDAPPGQWNWVDFPDAICRDGSSTGIGVRYGSSPNLVIYFMGGGACFNALTCAQNPASFDGGDFNGSNSGIFDTSGNNPVGDWSFIFVPYCTGDVHAGDRPDQMSEAGIQQFVGYRNVAAYLERIVPTFGDADHVVVTGESAGGFGAAFNYDRIADAFPGKKVTLLDDSGPPLGFSVAPLCLQQKWSDLWGFDDTIPAGCQDCFPSQGGGIVNIGKHIAAKHSDQHLALISSTGDSVIRFFFGFGANNCTALIPGTDQQAFEDALIDARDNFFNAPAGVWGSFLVDNSTQHTWLSGSYFDAEVGGVKLVDWVADLIDGTATHVGP